MALHFTDAGPRVTEATIDGICSKFHLELPRDFRDFLVNTNGGIPESRGLTIPDHPDGTDRIDFFFSIGHPQSYRNLERCLEGIPAYAAAGLVPVAATSCASLICLETRVPTAGVVYVDIADPLTPDGLKRTWPLTPTFAAFCALLDHRSP